MRMCQYCPGMLATVSGEMQGMQGLIQDFQKGGGGGGGNGRKATARGKVWEGRNNGQSLSATTPLIFQVLQ